MKGIYIYPSDMGYSSEWNEGWVKFITKFGYNGTGSPWAYILVVHIDID